MENLVQIWHNTNVPCYFFMVLDWKPSGKSPNFVKPIKKVTESVAVDICEKFNFKNAPDDYLSLESF